MEFVEELRSLFVGMLVIFLGLLFGIIGLMSANYLYFAFHLSIWAFYGMGLPFNIIEIFFCWRLWKLRKKMRRWGGNFRKFSYIFRFDAYPPEGKTPQERILNQLLVANREVGNWLNRYLKVSRGMRTFLNVKVRGKKDEHFFDVYVGEELLKSDKSKVAQDTKSKLRKHGAIFVKRFDKREFTDEKDLEGLKEEIHDVISKTKSKPHNIVVVSTLGFKKSVRPYVKNKKNWLKGCPFDLIQETQHGYTVFDVQ